MLRPSRSNRPMSSWHCATPIPPACQRQGGKALSPRFSDGWLCRTTQTSRRHRHGRFFDAAAADKGKSIWRLARHVESPTLAIYGTEDQLVPVELAPKAAAVLKNCRVTILPTAATARRWNIRHSPRRCSCGGWPSPVPA